MRPLPAEARASVVLGDGPRRVLLLHGLTGTSAQGRPIADALHAAGFVVRGDIFAPIHAKNETTALEEFQLSVEPLCRNEQATVYRS